MIVLQDLEAPYRPNVSSYEGGADIYNKDEARVERKIVKRPKTTTGKRADPHPSASTPSFKSLAIFTGQFSSSLTSRETKLIEMGTTGEEERFAYKRAVSRVFEMDSSEYLRTAIWTPLAPALRTWEQSVKPPPPSPAVEQVSRSSMGTAIPLEGSLDKVSGVGIDMMRLRYPDGMPEPVKSVSINRGGPKKGEKIDMDKVVDTRELNPPVIKEVHAWGVADTWGKKAGKWGEGSKAFEKKKEE